MKVGGLYQGENRCTFRVWAPYAEEMSVHFPERPQRTVPMERLEEGYYQVTCPDTPPETRYSYLLPGGQQRPDPASRFQPGDVHGPSEVVDQGRYPWRDSAWRMFPKEEIIAYELHTGTFTPEGTFEAVIPRLDALQELGVNTLNLMPVAQFPGSRNWGYDGVLLYAVQNTYGGPQGLKQLVDACHCRDMAVILDVVYNHLGPEGNYLAQFGPYFTETYQTPWGEALNFDGAHSDQVRNFFIENALYWLREFHVDGLRLDAVHAILDMSAKPFLQELAEKVDYFRKQHKRQAYLIPESDLNDTRLIRSRESGGFGHDAQWNDDFHHALHALLTGENHGYYQDFGRPAHLTKSLQQGYAYTWDYSPYRRRHHGNYSMDIPGDRFVAFSQNHDQVGNRMLGDRLSSLVSFEALKLAAASVLLSPFLPLLFMGEEYGEEAPFLYFVSHSDPDLIQAVREGRKKEFAVFDWPGDPPDPQSEATFQRCILNWEQRSQGDHKRLLDFYRELIRLRRELPALAHPDRGSRKAWSDDRKKLVFLQRNNQGGQVLCLYSFGAMEQRVELDPGPGEWSRVLDSAGSAWGGPGSFLPERVASGQEVRIAPWSAAAYSNC
ncbi:MAG: malto-oligosyltrehalose trehalohydrolase [Desulfohalobiaceae bacterium]|nr:malto-oligosyltrehalose trehalohydrolase [Desulfohalobiaceae bacterium]